MSFRYPPIVLSFPRISFAGVARPLLLIGPCATSWLDGGRVPGVWASCLSYPLWTLWD